MLSINVEPGEEYSITDTTADIESLRIKASFLPEGADLLRTSPEELRVEYEESLHRAVNLNLKPWYRDFTFGLAREYLTEEAADDLETRAILDQANDEIWVVQSGETSTGISGQQAMKDRREAEDRSFGDRWYFQDRKEGLKVRWGAVVVPEAISLDGLAVSIKGRYKSIAWDTPIYCRGAAETPDGWQLLASIGYDFDSAEGSIQFE